MNTIISLILHTTLVHFESKLEEQTSWTGGVHIDDSKSHSNPIETDRMLVPESS